MTFQLLKTAAKLWPGGDTYRLHTVCYCTCTAACSIDMCTPGDAVVNFISSSTAGHKASNLSKKQEEIVYRNCVAFVYR